MNIRDNFLHNQSLNCSQYPLRVPNAICNPASIASSISISPLNKPRTVSNGKPDFSARSTGLISRNLIVSTNVSLSLLIPLSHCEAKIGQPL